VIEILVDITRWIQPVRLTLPSISYVVARSLPGFVIGSENRLPWHLGTDLRRFKKITIGHPIIMGRKTHLSIGRPLPGRVNIVLSRNADQNVENDFWQRMETAVVWAGNLESALYFADVASIARDQSDIFIIGGEKMYDLFNKLFNKIYLTEVLPGKRLAGDATFRFPIDRRQWQTLEDADFPASPSDEYPSRFRVLERKRKWVRYVEINEFYTDSAARQHWLNRQLDLFEDFKTKNVRKPFVIPYQYKLFEEKTAA
jgi:dihydrofolate reductase